MSKIWAHRGASSDAPENTLPAFELAVDQGADGIELDVMRTRDNVIVVTHDEFCHRLTGQEGMVRAMDYADLKKLNYAWHFSGYPRQQIATLADVLKLVRSSGIAVNIDLKNDHYFDEGLVDAVIGKVVAHDMAQKTILSSFNHFSIQKAVQIIQQNGYGIKCGLLYTCCLIDPWQYAREIEVQAVHPLYANLQLPDFVVKCHENNLSVNAWTINNPEHIAMAIKLNVDAVITDVPETAVEIRGQIMPENR